MWQSIVCSLEEHRHEVQPAKCNVWHPRDTPSRPAGGGGPRQHGGTHPSYHRPPPHHVNRGRQAVRDRHRPRLRARGSRCPEACKSSTGALRPHRGACHHRARARPSPDRLVAPDQVCSQSIRHLCQTGPSLGPQSGYECIGQHTKGDGEPDHGAAHERRAVAADPATGCTGRVQTQAPEYHHARGVFGRRGQPTRGRREPSRKPWAETATTRPPMRMLQR